MDKQSYWADMVVPEPGKRSVLSIILGVLVGLQFLIYPLYGISLARGGTIYWVTIIGCTLYSLILMLTCLYLAWRGIERPAYAIVSSWLSTVTFLLVFALLLIG